MGKNAAPKAVIYARLSRNRTGEQSESTKRQVDACRKLATDRGYEVVAVEIDDDVSAYSGRVRPGYERVLEALRAGAASVVIAWATDRLHRDLKQLEEFIDLLEETGSHAVTVQGGRVDLETPSGRMNARMLGTIARFESEHRSARTSAAKAAKAARGDWLGGKRPFGYRPDGAGGLVVDRHEAKVIRESARRLLAGVRPGTIARELNEAGVPTVSGGKWRIPTIRGILGGAMVAGVLVHHGEEIGPGNWEPILDPATVRDVRAVLANGAKRGRRPRVALFTGDRIVCGRCGHNMVTASKQTTAQRLRTYRCPECLLAVSAEPLEALVTEAVFQRLDGADLSTDDTEAVDAAREADRIETDLERLAAAHGAGEISFTEWQAARAPMVERLAAARSAAQVAGNRALEGFTGEGVLRSAWDGLTLEQRQAVIDAVLLNVTVNPTERRGPVFDIERVDIEWR